MVFRRTKMNLGFYVHSTSDTPLNKDISQLLNEAVENGVVKDASLFYNNIDFSPTGKKFGTFNSTDLWSFNGTLVVTNLTLLPMASNIVNKIKLIYLYASSEIKKGDMGQLMELLNLSEKIPVVARDPDDKKEFYRLTKHTIPVLDKFSAEEILKV
jgi:hypothetical protein